MRGRFDIKTAYENNDVTLSSFSSFKLKFLLTNSLIGWAYQIVLPVPKHEIVLDIISMSFKCWETSTEAKIYKFRIYDSAEGQTLLRRQALYENHTFVSRLSTTKVIRWTGCEQLKARF